MMRKIKLTALAFLVVAISLFGQQNTNTSTTICWDSSLSMKERDIDKEFSFLEEYFATNTEAEVTILLFSNTIIGKESFQVSSGRWGLVKEYLSNVTYDGGTSFKGLAAQVNQGDVLMFTDGHQNTNSESPYFQAEVFVINSKKDFNQANLNLLAILNSGSFFNLSGQAKQDSLRIRNYFGKIQGAHIANRQVEVAIKGKEAETVRPEEDGSYRIDALEGDVLVVTAAGGKRIEKTLGENRNIDIWLGGTDQIRLEEVVVTGIQEEPVIEKETALGRKNEESVGYAVQTITEDNISDISTTVNNATQGKFSGVSLGQNDDLSQVIMRPSNSINATNYGLVVVDGVPLQRSDSSAGVITAAGPFQSPSQGSTQPNDTSRSSAVRGTGFLNPQNIASITVLKGLAATNRFGSLGANGVILITTKTASVRKGEEIKDLAMLTDNIYEGKLKVSAKTLVTPYLKALKKAKNLEEAYNIYLKQRDQYANDPAFYIDVYDYFLPSSKPLALRVLSNVLEDETLEYSTLRAMFFKCQAEALHGMELEAANMLLERFPDKSQSYLDLAIALKHNGQFQQSLDQLLKMTDENSAGGLDHSGLKKSVDAEIRNLIYKHSRELDLSKVDTKFKSNLRYNARVIIDWNHPSSEFELQFVNPQNRFFTWEHHSLVNADRLQQEWDQGFGREEFEIVGEETRGEWLINLKYLGNANESDTTPTFMRCTVQYNFGKPDQREEIHTIRLHERDTEEQFVTLNIQ